MNAKIMIVKDKYAAEAERLDQLGLPVPSFMVEEVIECEVVQLLTPTEAEIDALLARFAK